MDPTLVGLALIGSIFFPIIFLVCAFLLRKWVGIESKAVQIAVAVRLTSILQAVMASTCGWYIVIHCYHDFLYARCWLVDVYISFGFPYMLYDIAAMYAAYHTNAQEKRDAILSKKSTFLPFIQREQLIIFHHLLVALVAFPIAVGYRNGKGEFFIGCMLLTELSSPFVNLRAILKIIKRRGSRLDHINNALILLVYFLCRILIFPILFWVYGRDRYIYWFQVPMAIPWHCTVGCTTIGGFQLMWYMTFARNIWRTYQREGTMDANKNLPHDAAKAKLE